MFTKLVSFVLSFVMAVTGLVSTAFNDIIDSVSEMLFGIPYTFEAVKSDFFSEIDDGDVVKLDESSGFIRDKIAVFIDSDMSFSQKLEFFSSCGGILAGWCTPSDLYILSYPAMSYEQMLEKCKKLDGTEGVELSVPVMAYKTETNVTPADDFGATPEEPLGWDELAPDGANWWLEAVNARQAWDYSDYFSTANIGIIDAGFETDHAELVGKISFPNDKQAGRNIPNAHGTHVAGIVAASHNGTGIAGICENSKLICIDWQPDFLQFWSTDISIYFGFSTLVKAGAKVINLSLGTAASKMKNGMDFMERVIGTAATSYIMASLISKGYDFIAVQSAGNGDHFGDPIDAVNNGHFCSLTEDNIFVGSKNVSVQDILDRIIVVASASNNGDGTYTQSVFTNVGSRVSVAAPGEDIYSCSIDGGYENMSGTSMAAPVVTGIASLVWSVNPSFKGSEVKEIVCTSTDTVAQIYTEADYYYDVELMEYPMVNAKLAVEEAVKRTDSTVGTAKGRVIGHAETIAFNGSSYTVYSDGTYSFVAPECNGTAEIYDRYGNVIGSFELAVTAGQTTVAEDYTIEF